MANALSAQDFEVVNFILYQPDSILDQRVTSVAALANYSKKLEVVCVGFFASQTVPHLIDIVVAIRPGKRSRVWFVLDVGHTNHDSLNALRDKLEVIEPPEVRNGPVAFALSARIAGASRALPDPRRGAYAPPIPEDWTSAAAKLGAREHSLDEILTVAWPDTH